MRVNVAATAFVLVGFGAESADDPFSDAGRQLEKLGLTECSAVQEAGPTEEEAP